MAKPVVLGIIPARGGSKGLPDKNIKILGDKPLIAHSIKEAKKSKWLKDLVVSTDSDKIKYISEQYEATVPYMRPNELSSDTATSVDVILHHLDYLEENNLDIPNYICMMQCTTPFRQVEDIDGAIQKCIESEADACVSLCASKSNPYWMVTLDENRIKDFVDKGERALRRQDLPEVYTFNGAIYVIKTQILREKKTFFPPNTVGYVMDKERSIDIDTLLDFKICEIIYKEKHTQSEG